MISCVTPLMTFFSYNFTSLFHSMHVLLSGSQINGTIVFDNKLVELRVLREQRDESVSLVDASLLPNMDHS